MIFQKHDMDRGGTVHTVVSRALLLWHGGTSEGDGSGWIVFLYYSLVCMYHYMSRHSPGSLPYHAYLYRRFPDQLEVRILFLDLKCDTLELVRRQYPVYFGISQSIVTNKSEKTRLCMRLKS